MAKWKTRIYKLRIWRAVGVWSIYLEYKRCLSVLFCEAHLKMCLVFFCLDLVQCWRGLCCDSPDKGPAVLWRPDKMDAPGHLQIFLQHRCHLFPVWPTKLQNEVRLVDLRPCQNRSGQHGEWCGPDGLLGEWGVGYCQCSGQVQYQKIRVLHGDLFRYHILLHHPEASVVLHDQSHHPLSPYLLLDCAGVLFAFTVRREDHLMYLSATISYSVSPADHRDHTINVSGDPTDRRILAVHHGLCYPFHHNYRLCVERPPSIAADPRHATLGEESVLGLCSKSSLYEASAGHGQAALQKADRDDAPSCYRVRSGKFVVLLDRARDRIETDGPGAENNPKGAHR